MTESEQTTRPAGQERLATQCAPASIVASGSTSERCKRKKQKRDSLKPSQIFVQRTCENYHKLINESPPKRARRRNSFIIEGPPRQRGRGEATTKRRAGRAQSPFRPPLPSPPQRSVSSARHSKGLRRAGSKMMRLIRWPLVHLCLPLCLTTLVLLTAEASRHLPLTQQQQQHHQQQQQQPHHYHNHQAHSTRTGPSNSQPPLPAGPLASSSAPPGRSAAEMRSFGTSRIMDDQERGAGAEREIKTQNFHRAAGRTRRSPPRATSGFHQQQQQRPQSASSLLMPINELRVSGSKLEPPSRPSQDWSKQRPYFGASLQRNVSVELGKTAHLVCKVFELGDKTVSWLRPRENEILTAGKYTYVSDPRISAMNENGSTDWVLEIKDAGLNDSTSYECQVSTDPKLSQTFNLHVQAARARIKTAENNHYPPGASIEFACEILPPLHHHHQHAASRAHLSPSGAPFSGADQQIFWYHNGNLMNYAKTLGQDSGEPARQNFTIDWDAGGQVSKLRLANIQPTDSGNYTCRPTSAEPATVRLFVKKPRAPNRAHYSGGAYHVPNAKEAQRTRQHHEVGVDFVESSGAGGSRAELQVDLVTLSMLLALIATITSRLLPRDSLTRI